MINYIVARKKNMTDGSIKYYAKVAPVSPVYVNDMPPASRRPVR